MSDCSDGAIMILAARAAGELAAHSKTAIVLLTSTCPEDSHGTHVTAAVVNGTGNMTPSEARAAVRRLRSLADELEQRFAPIGSEN